MRLKINHQTSYRYDEPVNYALQQLRLTPKSRAGQTVFNWETTIKGGQLELEFDDQHHNNVQLVSFEPGGTEIIIHSIGEVETIDNNGVVGEHGGYAPLWYFERPTELTKPGPNIRKLMKKVNRSNGDIPGLHHLCDLIKGKVRYETGKTDTSTLAEEALQNRRGVCQDHAHIFITIARLMGYPARYVSGYLLMDEQINQDASHAWAEAYVENIGWIGFDVSNSICPDERYVRVATGLDYRDAAPINGMRFGQSAESMLVTLQVQQ